MRHLPLQPDRLLRLCTLASSSLVELLPPSASKQSVDVSRPYAHQEICLSPRGVQAAKMRVCLSTRLVWNCFPRSLRAKKCFLCQAYQLCLVSMQMRYLVAVQLLLLLLRWLAQQVCWHNAPQQRQGCHQGQQAPNKRPSALHFAGLRERPPGFRLLNSPSRPARPLTIVLCLRLALLDLALPPAMPLHNRCRLEHIALLRCLSGWRMSRWGRPLAARSPPSAMCR
mmetsp:Transcript_57566/g.106362  ORF Transcript_57566/g.106362 Transcript_57566/m.106362 type:complete len:226 (+) Transcript_57566:469-1146(+)